MLWCALISLVPLVFSAAVPSPGFVSYELSSGNKLSKRGLGYLPDSEVDHMRKWWYYIHLDVGSDLQETLFLFDTGSTMTWCEERYWNPSSSSTYHNDSVEFTVTYYKGSPLLGWVGKDQVRLHGTNTVLNNITIGTVPGITGYGAIYGAGPPLDNGHPSFLQHLKNEGVVNTVAFGIFMNTNTEKKGQVTFGGIDTSKYVGTLQKVPIVNTPRKNPDGTFTYPAGIINTNVALSSIGAADTKGNKVDIVTGAARPACLDTGTWFAVVPLSWHKALGKAFGAEWSEKHGACMRDTIPEGSVIFGFSGVEVAADVQAFWNPVKDDDGKTIYVMNQIRTIPDSSDINNQMLFGNLFQRYAYLVFDFEHGELGIAQAVTGDGGSESIVAIPSSGIDAPRASQYLSTYHSEFTLVQPTPFA